MNEHSTSLEQEIKRMVEVVNDRLAGYSPPLGSAAESLWRIFKRHSRGQISSPEENKIRLAINSALKDEREIFMGICWAFGGMSLSGYKFREPKVNLPRLGDLWGLFWLLILNEKIKRIHPPGLKLIIADEEPHHFFLGHLPTKVARRQRIMTAVAAQYTSFITLTALPAYQGVAKAITIPEPSDEEILSIVGCLPQDNIPSAAFSQLYQEREKDWSTIRDLIPAAKWQEAREIIIKMLQIGEARKREGFFPHLFGFQPYIDAAITEKSRWSPKAWGKTCPQHGGSLLRRGDNGQFSITITPESRLLAEGYQPIRLRGEEFGKLDPSLATDEEYTFYWLEP